jgi:hypothetical protein
MVKKSELGFYPYLTDYPERYFYQANKKNQVKITVRTKEELGISAI